MLDIPAEPIQTKDHGLRWLHTKKLPLYDHAGVPRYLLGISEDITDQKQRRKSNSSAWGNSQRNRRSSTSWPRTRPFIADTRNRRSRDD